MVKQLHKKIDVIDCSSPNNRKLNLILYSQPMHIIKFLQQVKILINFELLAV